MPVYIQCILPYQPHVENWESTVKNNNFRFGPLYGFREKANIQKTKQLSEHIIENTVVDVAVCSEPNPRSPGDTDCPLPHRSQTNHEHLIKKSVFDGAIISA